MRNKSNRLIRVLIATALFATGATGALAQTGAPRDERLLNGLRLLVWNAPGNNKVSVKTRIHSGSAFDPLGKEGTMKLLSEIIFPNDAARDFFREDLGGDLEIVCTYDYIQVNATGDADKILTILETLATALTNPQINKETTERVKESHLPKLAEREADPAYIADRAVARRLLGNYPLGRPIWGTPESVAKVDFADLLFAKERFLTADNATVTVSGAVKADLVLRAAKRLFGSWLKADKKVPATFAQPEAPPAKMAFIDATAANVSELRFAIRGVARSDTDYHAMKIARAVLERRVRAREGQRAFVRADSGVLPGIVVIGVNAWNLATVRKVGAEVTLPADIGDYPGVFLNTPVSAEEFEAAKRETAESAARLDTPENWLDAHTFRLASVKDDQAAFQATALADVQRALDRMKGNPTASLLLITPTAASN